MEDVLGLTESLMYTCAHVQLHEYSATCVIATGCHTSRLHLRGCHLP
jgi:hypothetical protein